MFSKCTTSCTFPNIFKVEQVIPTHKSGPKNQCFNCHPISISIPFSKLFVKCIYEQIYNYFTKIKFSTLNQFSFEQNISTGHAVRHLYGHLIQNSDKKRILCFDFLT